jgi:hypothetical protein
MSKISILSTKQGLLLCRFFASWEARAPAWRAEKGFVGVKKIFGPGEGRGGENGENVRENGKKWG